MQARLVRPSTHFPNTLSSAYRAFDAVATWVTQLSWWKFFLFAALMLVAGQILQDELFSGGEEEIARTEKRARKDEPTIVIDDSGIHINPRASAMASPPSASAAAAKAAAAAAQAFRECRPGGECGPGRSRPTPGWRTGARPRPQSRERQPRRPTYPGPARCRSKRPSPRHPRRERRVHIDLPPQIGEELSDAIEARSTMPPKPRRRATTSRPRPGSPASSGCWCWPCSAPRP
jgi:hypothetical protein